MRMFFTASVGLVIGGGLIFAIGMALPVLVPISQTEGAYAMGVAFVWTPLGGILGAIVAIFVVRSGRRP